VIDVSIVSLPSYDPMPSGPKPKTDGTAKTDAVSKTVPSKTDPGAKTDTPVAERFRPKTSLKKKTFKSSRVVKHAISQIEKQIESSRAQPVREAIDGLRESVADADASAVGSAEEGISASQGRSGTGGRRALELMDIYKAEIPYHIQRNWVFSEQLAGGRTGLAAWLVIEIRPDGSLRDIWFEKRSGNRYFDEQAFKAIKKSDPLPPLPNGYARPFFNVGLRFTPSGLR